MIMRITAKLGKKIHMIPPKSLPADANPFADWSAHLFTADRTQYILVSNTVALYSLVLFGKGITDDGIFLDQTLNYMNEFLRDDGLGEIFENRIAPSSARISFSKALNKSVTGSMNDLIRFAKYYLVERETSPWDTSFILNDILFSYLKYEKPRDVFLSLMKD
jgi:hypothetical protein